MICVQGGGATHSIFDIDEWIIDSDNVDLIVFDGIAKDNTSDATEAIDSNLGGSHDSAELLASVILLRRQQAQLREVGAC